MKGIFIAIEGMDGSGKGYAMMRLQEYIMGKSKKYDHLLLTREPTYGQYGIQIREMLKKQTDPYKDAKRMLELYVADRKNHLEQHILPALSRGYIVLCDRYKYSTYAFQQAQGIPFEEIEKAHEGIASPDITFILDLPAAQAVARLRYRDWKTKNEKFENEEFMTKLQEKYLELPIRLPKDKIVIIDASVEKEEMFTQIREELEKSGILPY